MYTGARIFYGTIGSLSRFVNDDAMQVSGYGLVVGLNGTGSAEVPPILKPYMADMVRRGGLNPTIVLGDPNTAVVSVQGLVPPGAQKGDRFDLWVESTVSSVTSLAGGKLFTTDLQPGPLARDPGKYTGLAGLGSGFIYMDPFDRESFPASGMNGLSWSQFQRQALILGGGRLTESRQLALVLNQPSFSVANRMVDAINSRFPQSRADRSPAAQAHDEQRITLNVPAAFRRDPAAFIDQVRWLYIQRIDPAFVPEQTEAMLRALPEESKPEVRAEFAEHCVQAWKAMGKGTLAKLRPAYALAPNGALEKQLWPQAAQDPVKLNKLRDAYPDVRDAALRAGMAMGDVEAIDILVASIPQLDAAGRRRVAEILVEQPNNRGVLAALRMLIGDPDRSVRVAAYESYSACFGRLADVVGEQEAERLMGGEFHRTMAYAYDDGAERARYAVDVVPIGEPLVLMSVSGWPRVAILGRDPGLRKPMSVWFEGDGARRTPGADAAGMAAAAHELALKTGVSDAQAAAQLAALAKASAPIPFAGAGRLNLRVNDEVTAKELRTATARQLKAEKGISFVEAMKLVPEMREVLAFSFYPGDGTKQEFKATNTLATLAFTLGQHTGARYPLPGLDFQFDRVTRIMNQLSKRGMIAAPVEIRVSPLAERMRRAAEQARKPNEGRPEGAVEDLTKELGPGAKPAPGQAKPAASGTGAAPPATGPNPFDQH